MTTKSRTYFNIILQTHASTQSSLQQSKVQTAFSSTSHQTHERAAPAALEKCMKIASCCTSICTMQALGRQRKTGAGGRAARFACTFVLTCTSDMYLCLMYTCTCIHLTGPACEARWKRAYAASRACCMVDRRHAYARYAGLEDWTPWASCLGVVRWYLSPLDSAL
jgi:hypothetical protein